QISVTVPVGASSGPVGVITAAGSVVTAGTFTVTHEATISLRLRDAGSRLVASGNVQVSDGTSGCLGGRRVIIQRRHHGGWEKIAKTTTSSDGSYKAKFLDVAGKIRAHLKKKTLAGGDLCLAATS